MTNIKKAFYGILTAFTMLSISVFSQFGIQSLIEAATGWRPPKWLAVTINAISVAGAIVSIVASFGVTLPAWAAGAAATMASATA